MTDSLRMPTADAEKTRRRCRWCDEGAELVGSQHWIVKSIIPAKIVIKDCGAGLTERP